MKEDIIQWNCSEFGNVDRQKKELLEALKLLDAMEGEYGLSEVQIGERAVLRSQNTKFFHKVANYRRMYNHISMLEVNGVIYEDESKMVDQVVQFYKNLYKETKEWRLFVEGLEFDQIEGLERDWLE